MTWSTLSWSFGTILTSADMNGLYNNFAAMANGDSGAPSIVHAALDSDCVTFAREIDDTIADGSLDCSAGAYQTVPNGVILLTCSAGNADIELYVNGAWFLYANITTTFITQVISDGSSLCARVGGKLGTNTVKYRKIFS